MSGRAQLIQRSRQVKRRRKMIQLAGLIFLILFAVGLIIYTLHRPRWRIEDIKVIGAKSLNNEEIVNLIKKETSNSYFWLIPKNSRLFYPEEALSEKVLKAFPRIASIDLDKKGQSLNINISERESELLWCAVGNEDIKDCYFVDITGIAFAKAPNFTDHVLFEVHVKNNTTTTATSSVLGQPVLSSKTLESIFSQKESIHKVLANQKTLDRSIIISAELIPAEGYSFNIMSAGASQEYWRLLTSAKMSGDDLSKILTALLDSGAFEKNVLKSKQPLSYIDARLVSKVFFKTMNDYATSTQ